jgi:hypothetical protein
LHTNVITSKSRSKLINRIGPRNPYSALGSVAILKEKLRPVPEIRLLLAELAASDNTLEAAKRRKVAFKALAQLPDSTT